MIVNAFKVIDSFTPSRLDASIIFMMFRVFFAVVLVITSLTSFLVWMVGDQGVKPSYFKKYKTAHVTFDEWGIPTLEADNWEKVVEAQGFVTASDRLWQMDIMRRRVSGRLAEWFGEKAVDHDAEQRKMDYDYYVTKLSLPDEDLKFCEAYARGVNDFIEKRPNAWGLEYSLMREKPEPWTCQDTLRVLLLVAEDLTGEYKNDLLRAEWNAQLPKDWFDFLFKSYHPWASPTLGKETQNRKWPKQTLNWNAQSLSDEKNHFEQLPTAGSNAWVYHDEQSFFLANDTHLSYSVPQIWYALRLKVGTDEWAAGASIPGIFGIASGLTPHFAFGVTNLYDDVDNVILESVGDDGLYLASTDQKSPVWLPVLEKTQIIHVKSKNPQTIISKRTHRGPLLNWKDQYYSRQWLPFHVSTLSIPSIRLIQAKNWNEFNEVLDSNLAPSFAWLYAGKNGDIGFRATRADIQKKSIVPLPREAHEWPKEIRAKPKSSLLIKKNDKKRFLIAANHKHWDEVENFAVEDRHYRIREILVGMQGPTREDIELMQMDAQVPFFRVLEAWLKKHDQHSCLQQHEIKNELFEAIESRLLALLLSNVQENFEISSPYASRRYRSWLLRVFLEDKWKALFGIEPKVLASVLCKDVMIRENIHNIQHPFVESLPLVGRLFRIPSYRQFGSKSAILATRPKAGPVFRMVWDMKIPERSRWIFPVGQSGHVGSPHYRDMNRYWQKDERILVFSQKDL